MGTDCAPFLANLFLFSYDYDFLETKLQEKDFDTLNKFKFCYRYIDDLLCINNDNAMEHFMHKIYPEELSLTSDSAVNSCNYLDLTLTIQNDKI